jgi:hypothetical protein
MKFTVESILTFPSVLLSGISVEFIV